MRGSEEEPSPAKIVESNRDQTTRADEELTSQEALTLVLENAGHGGLNRTVLVERVAEFARTTQADAEDALEDLRKRGEIWDIEGEYRLTPTRDRAPGWGSEFS